jgi:hypothetical protein
MIDRILGLHRKEKPKCYYPGCDRPPTTHWALVDLCAEHRETIRKETIRYYRHHIGYWDRSEYHQISHMIPWSRAMTKERDDEDEEAVIMKCDS